MPAPTFTASSTTALGRRGDCIIEMVVSSGGTGAAAPPTEGQLWPRGNPS